MQNIIAEDRLSALPNSLLLDILSLLPEYKEIVRICVLSKRWPSLWKAVPVSLEFDHPKSSGASISDFVSSTTRELHYCRCFEKIRTMTICLKNFQEEYAQDIDLWVHFAANVEGFTLKFEYVYFGDLVYEFPQLASSLKYLVLSGCRVKPLGAVNWSCLVSLSLRYMWFKEEGVMERVLSGCPNQECFEIEGVSGIHHLEINSKKLRKLILKYYSSVRLEISAPYVQYVELFGRPCFMLRNVDSLVIVDLNLRPDNSELFPEVREDMLKKMCTYFKELLHSVSHVENVELGSWFVE